MEYRYKCTVQYDGTNYHGWQVQENAKTVQEVIEHSLNEIHQRKVTIYGASRTDTGVHANFQVFHFDSDKDLGNDRFRLAINHFLPKDIYITSVERVSMEFHARKRVIKKEYIYKMNVGMYHPIWRNHTGFEYRSVDFTKMQEALQSLLGTHDYASFTSDGEYYHTIRSIYEVELTKEDDDILVFRFVGSGFMRYMIRIIVGTTLDIGAGKLDNMLEILQAKDRTKAGTKVSPSGLYLNHIWYEE